MHGGGARSPFRGSRCAEPWTPESSVSVRSAGCGCGDEERGETMGEGERETWTTEEFGSSHVGAVGVLLADGTVPDPVLFLSSSGAEARWLSERSVYDGRPHGGPRAAALRAVCSCGWAGPGRALDWNESDEEEGEDPREAAEAASPASLRYSFPHASDTRAAWASAHGVYFPDGLRSHDDSNEQAAGTRANSGSSALGRCLHTRATSSPSRTARPPDGHVVHSRDLVSTPLRCPAHCSPSRGPAPMPPDRNALCGQPPRSP
uniref:Uncharacterized protein n=1 Tax=Streptomyces flaveolus TaxID=67297 RepID=D3U9X5_9ACTN|nr:hypothetical protein [Streptomyces flaveolus]